MSKLSEFTVLQHIFKNKDRKQIMQINDKWFNEPSYRLLFGHWQLYPDLLNELSLIEYDRANSLGLEILIKELSQPINYPFEDAIKQIQRAFVNNHIVEGLKKTHEVLKKSENPDEAVKELLRVVRSMPSLHRKKRRITDGYQTDPPRLIKMHTPRRPLLEELFIEKGNMTVLAGRTSHQKSNQLIDMLDNALTANINDPNFHVTVFTKEMSFQKFRDRLMARKLRIPFAEIQKRVKGGANADEEFDKRFPEFLDRFHIYDGNEFNSVEDMTYLMLEDSPSVWGLDYLQDAADAFAGNSKDTNTNVIELITACKIMSVTFENHGIPLCQLKKDEMTRRLNFPLMAQIEWSGKITQLAQNVGMLYWYWKHNTRAFMNWYCVSWQKVRDGEIFNEILHTDPAMCDFHYEPAYPKNSTYAQYLLT